MEMNPLPGFKGRNPSVNSLREKVRLSRYVCASVVSNGFTSFERHSGQDARLGVFADSKVESHAEHSYSLISTPDSLPRSFFTKSPMAIIEQ